MSDALEPTYWIGQLCAECVRQLPGSDEEAVSKTSETTDTLHAGSCRTQLGVRVML